MAHYAYLDDNGVVTQVIVGKDETDTSQDWELYYGAKRTSYNTRGGQHILGGMPFRKNFAGIGFTYDAARDAFIPPQPFPSWVLDEATCLWKAPSPYPSDGGDYGWNEEAQEWQPVTQ